MPKRFWTEFALDEREILLPGNFCLNFDDFEFVVILFRFTNWGLVEF